MSSKITFDYSEYSEFIKSYTRLAKEFDKFLKEFLIEMTTRIVRQTKDNTPWDTGALRSTWGIGDDEFAAFESKGLAQKDWSGEEFSYENVQINVIKIEGNTLTLSIWNPMEYASYVEYGTPARPNWKWAEGAHMLTVSMNDIESQMPARFEEMFKLWCEEMGIT